MKKAILILVLLLFAGCSSEEPNTEIKEEMELFIDGGPMGRSVFKFQDGHVTCYVFVNKNRGGISCLK